MKTLLNGLKCAVFAVLAMGLALGAWAENALDTSKNPAAASVTTNGVTTEYATFTNAWAVACKVLETGADATVKMLKDATVESALTTGAKSNGALTLDLNDCVLAYAGQNDSLIKQESGTLHVVDTATPSAVHYFTRDKTTGLWTLANEVTDLSVKGGLLTGARNSAVYFSRNTGAHSISNVNFVGNRSTYNGGAVSTYNAFIGITITDCTFLGNVAPNNGGAVSSGNFTMTDCRVEENVASLDGGGLYVRDHASLVRTKVVGNKAAKGGGICVTYSPGGCFPAGVGILMADGSEKKVENISEGDVVATFDHLGGTNSSAAVFYVYRGTGGQSVFTLSFASGAKLDIADRHDLILETTRKYVTIAVDNVRSYIGSRFYNYATGSWDELTGVTAADDGGAHYSLYIRGHANCVANGMLTVPDDKDCFVNVYELDETLKADAAQLAADIAAYGLAEPADYPNVPLDDFGDYNMCYARIAIGKGLTTQEAILFWNEFDYGPVVAKKAKGALKLTTSAVEAKAPSAAYLQVGEGVVVTGNVNAAGTDNVYLDKGNNAVIDILSGTTDLDVGVTLSADTGIFGWTNDVNYASSFTSDNPDYAVAYTADKTLALRAGTQVGDDAWALINDGLCAVYGTGDMWSYATAGATPLWGYKNSITNIVISDAVTSVGTNSFAYMKGVKDVEIGGAVTNVCEDAFFSCLNVTNLIVGANVQMVGDSAFGRCNSLTDLSFGSSAVAEACQGKAFKIVARITMNGETPVVDAVPKVTIEGYTRALQGCEKLGDEWDTIQDENDIPEKYHFFRYVYEEEQ